MSNSAKTCKNGSKMTKNVPKCKLLDSVCPYLPLLKFKKGICILWETNRMACFDPIRVSNNKMNNIYFQKNSQSNNSPKLRKWSGI